MDSTSSHKIRSTGAIDSVADAPQSVRTNAANAEAIAVIERLLGLRMAQLNGPRDIVLQRIENRIFSIVEETRASISRDELHTVLDRNLNVALREIDPRLLYDAASERQKTQAIAQATYESLPADVIYQLAVISAPVNFAIENNQATSVVEVGTITLSMGPRNVLINLDHPFWRTSDFKNNQDIINAMINLKGSQMGLVTPNLRNHVITLFDAQQIVNQNFTVISASPVNRANLNINVTPATGAAFDFAVKADALEKGITNSDAPSGLQNRRIAELDPSEIWTVLQHRGIKGDFPYWKIFIDPSNGHQPDEIVTPAGGVSTPLIDIAVNLINNATSGRPLSERNISLLGAHTDVRSEHAKLESLMSKLSAESENQGGAALALALAASDPYVMASATQLAEETKTRTDLNKERAKLELSAQLKKMNELKMNLRIPTMPSGAPASYDLIFNERANLSHDIGIVGSATAPWTSAFCNSGGIAAPSSFSSSGDKRDMIVRLQQQMKEVSEELSRYEELANILKKVAQSAVAAELYNSSAEISRLVSNTGVVNRPNLTADINNVTVTETIKRQAKIESDADIEAAIKKHEETLKKSKGGGEKGDVLQQKIFEEHFKRQGVSGRESERSANYLYTRSFLDEELMGQYQALFDNIFQAVDHGPEQGSLQRKARHSLQDLTTTLGVRTVNGTYDWERVPYQTLVTGYFSLKKIYEGTAAEGIRASGSHEVQHEMRHVAEVLGRRHTHLLLTDMGNDLSEEDRKKLGSRKSLSVETLERFLTGEAPEKYNYRIDEVLHATEARIHRRTRYRRWVKKNVGLGLETAKVATTKTGEAVSTGVKWSWAQRKNIATFALFTALGGPLGIAAWTAMGPLNGSPAVAPAH